MLRIAVVTSYFPSSAEPWQGRSAYQTLRVLARQAEVQVFYPNAAYPKFFKPRNRRSRKLEISLNAQDVKAGYYDFPALPLVSRPFNGSMAARSILPHVRAFAPDLIFSYFLYPDGYAALKVGRALDVPVAAMSIGSDINRTGDRISAHHTRSVLREADFLLTVSEDLRRKALAMGASMGKSRSVTNGCDPAVFHLRDKQKARRSLDIQPDVEAVVYVGRMDVKKGLRELVEAAASLRERREKLQVYLVGEGPDRPLIESVVEENNAASCIHLRPGCSFDDAAIWMAAADVVTLPSYMEGCPNVVLEASACGRPVVATRVGGIPEIMSNVCGRLVPPRDPAALALALGSVLDTAWDAAAISASRSRGWDTVAEELLEVFEKLVSLHRATNAHG
jgi:teichuronic acid biosynthesis glycosyltransferase TuaC